jgi:di/tricarboxylate transporter
VSPAVISAIALLIAIVLSVITRINVGIVALAFAWLIGAYVEGVGLSVVTGAFPTSLFLTLTGVTLLFAVAQTNGTLERLALAAVSLARGNARFLPLIFFGIAMVISTAGPGSISTVALLIVLAMAIGQRAGVPHLLTALMVTNGANAGNLSPISAVGVIANTSMAEVGLGGHEAKVWFANFAASLVVALAAYFLLGGWRLGGDTADQAPTPALDDPQVAGSSRLTGAQRLTLGLILVWIVGVLVFEANLGLSAFATAALLIAFRTVNEGQAVRAMPWGTILLVTGVSLLVGVLEAVGGLELFTALLARLATPDIVNGVIALVTGAISIFSSTAGVVLPAFLPTAPGIVERLGGGDPLAVALSINVGSSLVDISPVSTLGALCVAAVVDTVAAEKLFRNLLIWGCAMSVVAAILCQLFIGPLARL